MGDLRAQLAPDVIDAEQVFAGVIEARFGFLAALAVLRHAGGLFEEHPQLFRPGIDDARDHALLDDGVGAGPEAGAEEDVGDIAPPHQAVVDEVARAGVAFEHPLDRNLAVLRPGAGRLAQRIVEDQLDACPVPRLAFAAAIEDDVVHGFATQMLGGRLAEHPADRVDDVGFATAVRTDDADEAARQRNMGGIDERLEAGELDVCEAHGLAR